jgi:ribosomal protein S18 acetylase RimI-like enzyme
MTGLHAQRLTQATGVLEGLQAVFQRKNPRIAIARWFAWVDGVLVGTVTLDLAMPPNQPHRAEVAKLLVHPAARRRGVAQTLMAALETKAAQRGRRLLTLDTRADDAGEALYRRLGWQEAGRIPGFALNADGSASATVFFYKQIGGA